MGFLTFLFCLSKCFSQYDFGVKINSGLSKISNSIKYDNVTSSIKPSISAQVGLYLNYNLYDSLFIGGDVLLLQIEGKEKMVYDEPSGPGIVPKTITENINTHLSYIGIPLYFGYKIKKMIVNIGFQYLYMIYSSSVDKFQIESQSFELRKSNLNLIKYNYGPSILFLFKLSEKINIEANYYYGLNTISKIIDFENRKIQQLTFGLKYKIF